MPGIPLSLHSICRETLVRCDVFQDYGALRSLFVVSELQPYRVGLPRGSSPAIQVEKCIEWLVDSTLPDGQSALSVFIGQLQERYRGDELFDDLGGVRAQVDHVLAPKRPNTIATGVVGEILYDRLLQLDFRKQVRLFRQVIDHCRVAAFLITGPPGHGQKLLADRLSRFKPEWQTAQWVKIDVGSNGIGKSSRSLWNQISRILGLSPGSDRNELALKVAEWWRTQDVIIVIQTVDYMRPLLSEWLKQFWEPIVSAAHSLQAKTLRETHLLLLLIDYSGEILHSDLPMTDNVDGIGLGEIPLSLPVIGPFELTELEIWLDGALEIIPTDITADTLIAEPIFGIPDLVYDHVCRACNLSWEGDLAR